MKVDNMDLVKTLRWNLHLNQDIIPMRPRLRFLHSLELMMKVTLWHRISDQLLKELLIVWTDQRYLLILQ